MIGETQRLQGSINAPVPGDKLLRSWQTHVSRDGVPLASLTTDGKTFRIVYQTWDVASLRKSFEIEVGRVGGRSTQVIYEPA